MLKIAIVIFREFLEIAIILSVMLALTKNLPKSKRYIFIGVIVGAILATLIILFIHNISSAFDGFGDEIFNTVIMLITVLLILYTITWMQNFNVKLKRNITKISDQISQSNASYFGLVVLIASAITREITEMILFSYSIAITHGSEYINYLLGLIFGAILGIGCGITIYFGLIKLPIKYIFKISSTLLIFIAASLASEAAGILVSSGLVSSSTYSQELWDSAWLISNNSNLGKILHSIIGYNARPSMLEGIFYISTILIAITCAKLYKFSKANH
ncbi:MAG: FTR1 family protein [Rickettsiaceae bacterium]